MNKGIAVMQGVLTIFAWGLCLLVASYYTLQSLTQKSSFEDKWSAVQKIQWDADLLLVLIGVYIFGRIITFLLDPLPKWRGGTES